MLDFYREQHPSIELVSTTLDLFGINFSFGLSGNRCLLMKIIDSNVFRTLSQFSSSVIFINCIYSFLQLIYNTFSME